MTSWLKSIQAVLILSALSFLTFLGRTFLDFYYVYRGFNLGVGMVSLTVLLSLGISAGWVWALMMAREEKRVVVFTLLGLDLFFFLVLGIGTVIAWCPTPCRTGWPLEEIMIWISVVVGFLNAVSLGMYLRDGKQRA